MHQTAANTIQAINRSNLSNTAKFVLLELVCDANEKRPHVYVDVKKVAQSIGKSVSTVRKGMRELVEGGYLVFEHLVVQLKHKVYKVLFSFVETVKNKTKKVAEKIVKNRSCEEQKGMKETKRSEEEDIALKEVDQTLKDFGFAESEREEVIRVNGVEKTSRLTLEYLESLKRGETMEVKKWFIARYVEEKKLLGIRFD